MQITHFIFILNLKIIINAAYLCERWEGWVRGAWEMEIFSVIFLLTSQLLWPIALWFRRASIRVLCILRSKRVVLISLQIWRHAKLCISPLSMPLRQLTWLLCRPGRFMRDADLRVMSELPDMSWGSTIHYCSTVRYIYF